jgi:branched-chain amino acid transport system permease protein
VSTIILLLLTGLGLAGLYFLVAAGLSLVFGLADVLNFAHGLFLSVGAYAHGGPRPACD